MAKVNVNTASREELLEVGGLRPDIVDEILKLRRKEKITSVETLDQVPGVGPATLEQLKKALDFSAEAKDDDREQRRQSEERRAAEEAARAPVEAVRGGLRVAQRTVEAAGEAQRETAQRSAEGASDLGQALVDLVQEQARHNLETWTALAGTVDWEQAFRIQGEFVRLSLERVSGLTQRYFEVTQTVLTAATESTRQQARKAA